MLITRGCMGVKRNFCRGWDKLSARGLAWGPSIKYVKLFSANFDPLPLLHFVTHHGTPKVRHTSRTPPILVGLVQKTWTKALCTNSLITCSRGFLSRGFIRGSFVWKVLSGVVFVRSPFCQNTSVSTES